MKFSTIANEGHVAALWVGEWPEDETGVDMATVGYEAGILARVYHALRSRKNDKGRRVDFFERCLHIAYDDDPCAFEFDDADDTGPATLLITVRKADSKLIDTANLLMALIAEWSPSGLIALCANELITTRQELTRAEYEATQRILRANEVALEAQRARDQAATESKRLQALMVANEKFVSELAAELGVRVEPVRNAIQRFAYVTPLNAEDPATVNVAGSETGTLPGTTGGQRTGNVSDHELRLNGTDVDGIVSHDVSPDDGTATTPTMVDDPSDQDLWEWDQTV